MSTNLDFAEERALGDGFSGVIPVNSFIAGRAGDSNLNSPRKPAPTVWGCRYLVVDASFDAGGEGVV